jgi:hypothetical protein
MDQWINGSNGSIHQLHSKPMALAFKDLRLRANPAYELVLYDRLSPAEKEALAPLGEDAECYGILRPRQNSHLTMKSISQDTALLLYSLQTAGPLPGYVQRALGEDCEAAIGKMLLDAVLEVEANGEMLSGPDAYHLIFGEPATPAPAGPNRARTIAAVSRRALEYAATLHLTQPAEVSGRLYAYNTIPLSPRWQNLLPSQAAVEVHLGLNNGASFAIDRQWARLPEAPAWISWQARNSSTKYTWPNENAATWKLYVSPAPLHLREAVKAAADAAAKAGAFHWKVGKDLRGLLRPDKIVVYFSEFDQLQQAATRLAIELADVPAQGVPFTAQLDDTGLLSWGIDPPVEQHAVPWLQRESWRLRVCNRLALALLQAEFAKQQKQSAAEFALTRLRLEGVDTDTWTPNAAKLWNH